jgi:hypothetical protein
MLLESGMMIYCIKGDHIAYRRKIDRITNTQAILTITRDGYDSYDIRFNREIPNSGCFRAKGYSDWSRGYYQVETPKLILKYERAILERKFSNIDASNLSNSQIISILDIANKDKP